MELPQPRLHDRQVEVVFARIMAKDGDFIDLRGGSNLAGANTIVSTRSEKTRRMRQYALTCGWH
jgi:hypothetical protein